MNYDMRIKIPYMIPRTGIVELLTKPATPGMLLRLIKEYYPLNTILNKGEITALDDTLTQANELLHLPDQTDSGTG
jgi:hypothetical protein